jgi:ribosomal protein L37E
MGQKESTILVFRAMKKNAVELRRRVGAAGPGRPSETLGDPSALASDIGKILRSKKAVLLIVNTYSPSGIKVEYALYEPWPNTAGVRRSVASFFKRKPSESEEASAKKAPSKKTVRKTVQKTVYVDVPAGPPCGSCGKPKNAHPMKHRWVSAKKKVSAKTTVRKTVRTTVNVDVPAGPPCGRCGKPKNAHPMKHLWVSAKKGKA